MKTFGFVHALIGFSACLVSAAPTTDTSILKRETNLGGIPGSAALSGSPANGIAKAGQDATAGFFKAGDAILNTPGDAIGKAMSGDPAGALKGMGQDAAKLAAGVPKDAAQIGKDMMGGDSKPKN